tara:strand:+ start:279 stop:482 length:204 start_codon:yes stop_codon:yes gene_type:complete
LKKNPQNPQKKPFEARKIGLKMNHTSSVTKISKTGLGTHTLFSYEDEHEEPPVMPKNAAKGGNDENP